MPCGRRTAEPQPWGSSVRVRMGVQVRQTQVTMGRWLCSSRRRQGLSLAIHEEAGYSQKTSPGKNDGFAEPANMPPPRRCAEGSLPQQQDKQPNGHYSYSTGDSRSPREAGGFPPLRDVGVI